MNDNDNSIIEALRNQLHIAVATRDALAERGMQAEAERDALRIELAEMTAEKNRLRWAHIAEEDKSSVLLEERDRARKALAELRVEKSILENNNQILRGIVTAMEDAIKSRASKQS